MSLAVFRWWELEISTALQDDAEYEMRMLLMAADIANKNADTAYKDGLLKYEPWKVVIVSADTGAGLMVALTALATFILSRL